VDALKNGGIPEPFAALTLKLDLRGRWRVRVIPAGPGRYTRPDSSLFNWLKDLDERAEELPPAEGWWTYPLFLFARYPSLRPSASEARRFDDCFVGCGDGQARLVSHWEKRIQDHPIAGAVLEGLTPDQQIQLAALMVDIENDFDTYKKRSVSKGSIGRLRSEAERNQRMLCRKLEKAQQAVERLLEYAEAVDPTISSGYVAAAKSARQALNVAPSIQTLNAFENSLTNYAAMQKILQHSEWFSCTGFFVTGLAWRETKPRSGLRLYGMHFGKNMAQTK
jgi:hypothetical protein